MAAEAQAQPEHEDETLELTEELEAGADDQSGDDEHQDDDAGDSGEGGSTDDGGEEETLVSFGDADPDDEQPDDNAVMRELRKRNRELNTKVRELETSTVAPKVELGPKPTLADFDYDEEKYEAGLEAWKAKEAGIRAQQQAVEEENRQVQQEWAADLQRFQEKKTALKMPDVEDCQSIVEEALNGVQQAVLVKAANDPALFMVALAKSPVKLAELAKMKDVIKLGAAIARMEGGIKVVTKRKAPNLDVPQRGSGRMPGADESSKTLAKLEKEADESGDRSKLIAFKKQQAGKGK